MANPTAYPWQPLGFVTVATAGSPVPMSATSLRVRGITVGAFKSKGVANSGANVYVQDAQGNVLFVIPRGDTMPLPLSHPQVSEMIDLAALFVDVDTGGDGLLVTALL